MDSYTTLQQCNFFPYTTLQIFKIYFFLFSIKIFILKEKMISQ